jgi:hypothetical protein
MLVAVFLAVMFTQTGFIGYDAGHRQISGSKRADGLIGRIHGNLLTGKSPTLAGSAAADPRR